MELIYFIVHPLKTYLSILLFLLFVALPNGLVYAQNEASNTVSIDTFSVNSPSSTSIESPINYNATDSILIYENGMVYLYGNATVAYEDIELKAAHIRLNLDSSLVYAVGVADTLGAVVGTPVFKEGTETYESKSLLYNFDSKKGLIYGTVTEQGEGFVTSGVTKKTSENIFCLEHGKYTTCNNHEHPHFYLSLTKAKMKQGDYIVTGPAYLVIEDVPLPLIIPFGFFPVPKMYSSGILFPTFGDEFRRGFYARNGGYYFAVNDYLDLALTTDLYTKGTWSVNAASSYVLRYKFRGNFNMSIMENILGERDMPDYSKSNDFRVMWSHSQDAKANPFSSLSASVNFSTSSYERNNINSYYNANLLSQNTRSSTVTYTHRFPESPFSISSSVYLNQRTRDSIISLSLPNFNVSMSRIYPFKRNEAVGSAKWFEKINMTYSGRFSNSITTKENELLTSSFTKDWKNGVEHSLPISASFTVLDYFTVTPSFSSKLRWYFSQVDQQWQGDALTGSAVSDTTNGFYNVFDYSASVSLQTKLYGFYKPMERIFGDRIQMIRHVITPSISISYKPDYGELSWGYWGNYERPLLDGSFSEVFYDKYSGQLYGTPSRGEAGTIGFSVSNNLEMKVKNKKDKQKEFTKVSLIDNLSVSSSYNMIADSLNWSNPNVSLRLKLHKQYTLNLNLLFDPYTYQLNGFGQPTRVNVTQLEKNGVIGRLMSTGTSFGYTFNNATFKRKTPTKNQENDAATLGETEVSVLEQEIMDLNPIDKKDTKQKEDANGYEKFSMPWSLSVNYSMRYAYANFNTAIMEYDRDLSHDVSVSGNVQFTENWRFTASSYYNVNTNEWSYVNCSVSRDLHCWSMSASFVPVGLYKSYNFMIGIKSSLLRDIKYEKQSNPYDNQVWY
ncbi:MAG: LPS-assembly protein LptD [Paludibacteraceae bacterium]|nr:LPS-assembly protein LptD [Paludibacteraceae bacterium]MBP6284763.1 LPS-assembly protein LptD [Paludibacteraceae bacterium]